MSRILHKASALVLAIGAGAAFLIGSPVLAQRYSEGRRPTRPSNSPSNTTNRPSWHIEFGRPSQPSWNTERPTTRPNWTIPNNTNNTRPSGQWSRPTYTPSNPPPTYRPSYSTPTSTPQYPTQTVPSQVQPVQNQLPQPDTTPVDNTVPQGLSLTDEQAAQMNKDLTKLQDAAFDADAKALSDAGFDMDPGAQIALGKYNATMKDPKSTQADRDQAYKELEEKTAGKLDQGKINGGRDLRDKLKKQKEQHDAIRQVQDQVASASAGSNTAGGGTLPPGSVTIIGWPALDAGQLVVVGSGTIVAGTGGVGSMTLGSGTLADLGIPVTTDSPVADHGDAAGLTSGALLENPRGSPAAVNYLVNGQPFTMEPGEYQELPAGQSYKVEFDRGGSNGKATYDLEDGSYAFYVDKNGWELYGQAHKVQIDNSANRTDFHYVVDNERAVVKGRKTQLHTSKYPLVVVFDQGRGGEPARKMLRSGTYKVGITPQGVLDLFPVEKDTAATDSGPTKPRQKTEARGARLLED